MEYTVDYFLAYFQNTRDDKWCTDKLHYDGKSCANGWCGVTSTANDDGKQSFWVTPESQALAIVFSCLATEDIKDDDYRYSNIAAVINNGYDERYPQPTPKQRILAALRDIKVMQDAQATSPVVEKPREDITKSLAVLPPEETLDLHFTKRGAALNE